MFGLHPTFTVPLVTGIVFFIIMLFNAARKSITIKKKLNGEISSLDDLKLLFRHVTVDKKLARFYIIIFIVFFAILALYDYTTFGGIENTKICIKIVAVFMFFASMVLIYITSSLRSLPVKKVELEEQYKRIIMHWSSMGKKYLKDIDKRVRTSNK